MTLSIGEVARQTGLSIHTLRFYDELGLLGQVKRAPNGHRAFDEDVLGWIGIIKCLRATEMPVAEVQRFARLGDQGRITQQRELLEAHRLEIERRRREVDAAIALIDQKITYIREAEAAAAAPGS